MKLLKKRLMKRAILFMFLIASTIATGQLIEDNYKIKKITIFIK